MSLFIECVAEKYDMDCDDFVEYLEELLKYKYIDENTSAYGITKKIITDRTVYTLNEYQFKTFYKYAFKPNYIEFCKRCHNTISWCEMSSAVGNGGYCGYCYNVINKDD